MYLNSLPEDEGKLIIRIPPDVYFCTFNPHLYSHVYVNFTMNNHHIDNMVYIVNKDTDNNTVLFRYINYLYEFSYNPSVLPEPNTNRNSLIYVSDQTNRGANLVIGTATSSSDFVLKNKKGEIILEIIDKEIIFNPELKVRFANTKELLPVQNLNTVPIVDTDPEIHLDFED